MARKVSIAYHLVADPGATGRVHVFKVPGGQRFRTRSVYILFPAGTYMELKIALYRGLDKIAPLEGYYVGDASVVEDEFVEDYYSDSDVIVHYVNENTTQTRECFILIRGELAP